MQTRADKGVTEDGSGEPVTLFASGGSGRGNYEWMRSWSSGLPGTHLCFEYGGVEPWLPGRPPRREAERDAAEARAVADEYGASCAVGVSRGARTVLGVLADDPSRFRRVVLVIPPAGTSAGRYREWLAELPDGSIGDAGMLILAMRGDSGHPVRVAQDWSHRLGAQLEVLPSANRQPDVLEVMAGLCTEFLDDLVA